MRGEVEALISAVLEEADAIDDLVDVVRDQREAVKVGDAEEMDGLMKEMHEVVFDVQTQELRRSDRAKRLAAQFGCEPCAESLAVPMEEAERALFNGAADRLTQSVFVLKSEMAILSGLIEQNKRYTAMLLSEWRRLMGEGAADAGAADFRG